MYSVLGLLMSLPFILHDISCLDCPSTYTQTNFILKHHVLSSTTVKNYQECYDKCASTTDCHSMNFYDRSQRCELNKGSHLSNPVDLVYNEQGTYSVHDSRSVATCSDKYCSTDTICVMKSNNFECKDCAFAFGMGVDSRKIPNSAITESSTVRSGHEPWRGRLNNFPNTTPYNVGVDAGCWSAGSNTAGEYLQVDLGHVVYVTMVATQGRPYGYKQYVRKYSLAYKNSDNSFVDYKIANNVKIFQANTDMTTIVTHRLPEKIKTQYIRFVAREWYGHISMRAEVYGCQIPV
ncbi:lactadherin-like [Actinia tenebrosa]|uniref:Lactadherin-like n=1 Tax=Actinia tenebrosa TaxID=6105 RepID=A0A6P8HML8_ACTTE|nr:lactadherin-like [Actinia tenebrosa]